MSKPLSAAPAKLRLVADLFDAQYPGQDTEAQDDLRHWADLIELLVDRIVDTAIVQATYARAVEFTAAWVPPAAADYHTRHAGKAVGQ